MGSWFILTVAVVSARCILSKSCSPCMFRWMENENYCYRYFSENLLYDEAEKYCEQFSRPRQVAELATVTGLKELTFIMKYIDKIFANQSSDDFPREVWLSKNTEETPGKWKISKLHLQ